MPTNTLLPNENTNEPDAFDAASNPVTRTYDLFGKVEIQAMGVALVAGQGKVPYDSTNPAHRSRLTEVKIYVQSLPEIEVKFPKTLESDWIAEFETWTKITLPSIRACGVDNIRELNNYYARISRVDSLEKPYDKKDAAGNLTGEKATKKTFKFIALYKTEDECRAAWIESGGTPKTGNSEPVPAQLMTDAQKLAQAKQNAYQFIPMIVQAAMRGKVGEDARAAVAEAIKGYPMCAEHFTVDSPEVIALMKV